MASRFIGRALSAHRAAAVARGAAAALRAPTTRYSLQAESAFAADVPRGSAAAAASPRAAAAAAADVQQRAAVLLVLDPILGVPIGSPLPSPAMPPARGGVGGAVLDLPLPRDGAVVIEDPAAGAELDTDLPPSAIGGALVDGGLWAMNRNAREGKVRRGRRDGGAAGGCPPLRV